MSPEEGQIQVSQPYQIEKDKYIVRVDSFIPQPRTFVHRSYIVRTAEDNGLQEIKSIEAAGNGRGNVLVH